MAGGFQPTPSSEQVHSKEKLQMLEERLRSVEGCSYDIRDATDLYLVPNVVISPKFKVPEFHTYKGTSCPKSHLTMYCRKMETSPVVISYSFIASKTA